MLSVFLGINLLDLDITILFKDAEDWMDLFVTLFLIGANFYWGYYHYQKIKRNREEREGNNKNKDHADATKDSNNNRVVYGLLGFTFPKKKGNLLNKIKKIYGFFRL